MCGTHDVDLLMVSVHCLADVEVWITKFSLLWIGIILGIALIIFKNQIFVTTEKEY